MHALTMAVGLWLAGAPAAPLQITDCYTVLAKNHAIDAVVEKRGGRWVYAANLGDVHDQGGLVVDEKRGFMHLEFGVDNTREVMELLLLTTRDHARTFVLVTTSGYAVNVELAGARAYEFTGGTYRVVTSGLGALTALSPMEFLDAAYAKSPAPADQADERLKLTRLTFELPRHGTTVVAHLEVQESPPAGDDGAAQLDATRAFVAAHQRYSWVNLTWNSETGTFAVGKKGP